MAGLDAVPWLDNRSAMTLREAPRHLLVLGGGYIGCAFAQTHRRFGSEVTVVGLLDRLLGLEDPAISASLASVFEQEGIRLELGRGAEAVAGRTRADRLIPITAPPTPRSRAWA